MICCSRAAIIAVIRSATALVRAVAEVSVRTRTPKVSRWVRKASRNKCWAT